MTSQDVREDSGSGGRSQVSTRPGPPGHVRDCFRPQATAEKVDACDGDRQRVRGTDRFGRSAVNMLRRLRAMASTQSTAAHGTRYHLRFHAPHAHLASVFGDNWFGSKAEGFARFFGTPTFLVAQTIIVAIWIGVNVVGLTRF